jgi:hypothetical protein
MADKINGFHSIKLAVLHGYRWKINRPVYWSLIGCVLKTVGQRSSIKYVAKTGHGRDFHPALAKA